MNKSSLLTPSLFIEFICRLALNCSLVLCLFTNVFAAQTTDIQINTLKKTISITGQWRFQVGDDADWSASTFDDSSWGSINVPRTWVEQGYSGYTGIGWYRLHLQLDMANDELSQLGIAIGRVHSAYEIYAGGRLLGGVGVLPPNPIPNYDGEEIYKIPSALISDSGELVIALRVWGGGNKVMTWSGGAYAGKYLIGKYSDLQLEALKFEMLPLLLMTIFFIFGVQHLYLFWLNSHLKEYMWYGLLAVFTSLYIFFISQWDYRLGIPFVLQKKIEFSILYFFPTLFFQVIITLLRLKIANWLRVYQYSFLLFAIVVIVVPDLHVNFVTLIIWQYWVIPGFIFVPSYVIYWAFKGNVEARTISVGIVFFIITAVIDLFALQYQTTAHRILGLGFFVFTVSMMMSFSNKFTALHKKLEAIVSTRTQELLVANERLNVVAMTDPLTGSLNRRGFFELAEREIIRFSRERKSFALVLMDIDLFKAVNDQYGHDCGDYVLQRLVSLINGTLRGVDIFSRWGGEEFIILLPDTDIGGAVVLAEKLRRELAVLSFEYDEHLFQVTMTLGVTNYLDGQNLSDCIQFADRALYRGKKNGRNIVEVEANIEDA